MLRHLLRTVNLFDTATSALFLCFLAACRGQSGGGDQARGLVYYETYDPRSLDPALSTDVPTGEMVTLLFDGLTQFDADGRLLPGLSDRWTADRKGQRYVFHLRPGVRFHDGHPLVAADVKRSFLRVLNPQTHGGRVWPLLPIAGAGDFADGRARDVRGIEVLGDTAVAFTLTEPLAIFPKFLAMPVASVVPSPLPADFGQRPVGTGPWRFVAWEHDDYLRFAKNPSYWGGAPLGESLTVRIIPEALTRAAEFLAGRISVVEVPFGETKKWEQEQPDLLKRKPALRPIYVPLNNRRGPLRDVRVRQAINHAVNVPEILRTVWNGSGALAAGSIPPTLGGSDPSRRPYSYDTTEARRLLRAAGYPNGFSLQLWRSGTNVEMGRVAHSLILVARRTVDQSAREALYRRIDTRVSDAAPWLYLWFAVDLWAEHPSIEGWDVPVIFNGQRWTKVRVAARR